MWSGSSNGRLRCTGPAGLPRQACQARLARDSRLAPLSWAKPLGLACSSRRQQGARNSSWLTVWLAPRFLSRAGRSALSSSRGMAPRSASTTAGNRLATALPEVVTTAAGTPAARPKPRAKKAADRSSTAVNSCRPPGSSSPAATARGAERLPGQSTSRSSPWRLRASNRPRAARRLASAVGGGGSTSTAATGVRISRSC